MIDEVRSELYNRSFGFGLAGIGAGLASRLYPTSPGMNALAMASAAMLGATVGDATHTKLPVGTILGSSAITGAIVAGIGFSAQNVISEGTDELVSAIKSGQLGLKPQEALSYIQNLRSTNKFAQRFLSKAGALGVVMGFSAPLVHKTVQQAVAQKSMETEATLASINNILDPDKKSEKRHTPREATKRDNNGVFLNITETIRNRYS